MNQQKKLSTMKQNVVRLGDFVDILSGFAFKSNQFSTETGVPLIRIRDVMRGHSETYYTGKYDELYLIKQGDILVGMDGEFNAAKWEGKPSLLNQRVCRIRSSVPSKLYNDYLFWLLPAKLKEIEDHTPFVTVKHLSVRDIKDIELPLPPLPIQKQMADTLSKADALRQKDKQLLQKYDDLAQSIFYDTFGDLNINKKGFERKLLGEVVSIPNKLVDPRILPFNELLHVGGDNIEGGTGELFNLRKASDLGLISGKFFFEENCVLYNKIRPYLNKVALPDFKGLCSADMYPLIPNQNILRVFLYYVLRSNGFLDFANSQSRRANIPKINREELFKYKVVLPPIELQQQFSEQINSIKKNKITLKKAIENTELLWKGLSNSFFGGH